MESQKCLNFVGIGSAYLPKLKNTSAWFVKENIFYLLDCGESTFEQIYDNKELLKSKEVIVLVTHLHCDHCGSLGSLISYCKFILNKVIKIYYPNTRIIDFLNIVGIEDNCYKFIENQKEIGDVLLKYYKVKHSEIMQCFGYLLCINSKQTYYSGDSKEIPNDIYNNFMNGKIEYIFQDTSLSENNHHCFFGDIIKIIPSEKRKNFYCMHLTSENVDEIVNSGFKIPIINVKNN